VHATSQASTLVRVGEKDFYVLEDNVRTPSGVLLRVETAKS